LASALVGELSEKISVDFSTVVSVILMKRKDEDKLLDRSKSKGREDEAFQFR